MPASFFLSANDAVPELTATQLPPLQLGGLRNLMGSLVPVFACNLPCATPSTRLEYASLRGAHALFDSSLPPIPRAMHRHLQRGAIPRPRHGVEFLGERVELSGDAPL